MAPTVNENGQNSQNGSRGWLSERDLLEAINEMGYNVSPDELTALRDDIEQFIEEEDRNEHNDDETNVSFSSLRFPDELRDNGRKKGLNNKKHLNDDNDELLSRFRSLNNAELLHERCAKSSTVAERAGAECDNKEDDSDDDELDRNAISDLIYEGYRCFEKLIADNQRITQLTKQVGLKKETQADGRNEVGEGVGYKRTSEEGEEKYEYEWPSLPVYSTPSDENFCQRSPPPAVDPCWFPFIMRFP
ncbi:unnamed protein product [Anisakis simplex]|uniref:SAP domain-containing protein n=1 Tax=Anisakis simplex TaxID=6269 RepID=A0A0M3J379_ANISI|nr:unnamed protein product [Anisakis simplex]